MSQNKDSENINVLDPNAASIESIVKPDAEYDESQNRTCCQEFVHEITQLRWRALILICFMCFGQYYIADFPGTIGTGDSYTIQSRFVTHGKKYNQAMNQALYSVYSYPNMFLAIFGGLLIDKYLGIRKATFLFMSCIFIGSVLFVVGVYATNYPLLVISRFIYGLGGESNTVASSAFAVRYFARSKWLALAFGISITFSRIGTSFTFMFSPMIAIKFGIGAASIAGAVACLISFLAVVILNIIDVYAENHGIVIKRTAEEMMNFRDILHFRPEVWILTAICVFGYCGFFPFAGIAMNFFEVRFNITGETASLYLSLYSYTSAVCGPFIGAFADKTGKHPIWLLAGCAGALIMHILAIATYTPPYIITILFGVSLTCLAAGLWPSIPYAVDENAVGFCYGVITALQNIGLATWPIICGVILDKNTPSADSPDAKTGDDGTVFATMKGYRTVEAFLIVTMILSIGLGILLIIIDRVHGVVLMCKPSVRAAKLKERDEKARAKLADSLVSISSS